MTDTITSRFELFNTEAQIFHSSCAGQDFQIGVWFPFSYSSSDRTFPVLYVPDGEYVFPVVAGLIPMLTGPGGVPEMLVVGISYHGISGWEEFGVLRDRDFCTQPFQTPPHETRHEQYSRFFQEELFPLIESQYRGDPHDRAIFGFSSGGFFGLHMLLTQPGMFRRHVAASCTWPGAGEYFLECAQRYADAAEQPKADLFLSVGDQDKEQLPGFAPLTGMLESGRAPNLRMQHHIFEGEGHSAGIIAKTLLMGLPAVYKE